MLALAAVNTLGAVAFAGLYATASKFNASSAAFVPVLVLAFAGVTCLWIRVERRGRQLDAVRRLGRAAGGLGAVLLGLPVAVLLPLFALEGQLPPDAAQELNLAPIMALLLVALALVAAVNGVAGVVTVGTALARRLGGRVRTPP